MRKTTHETQNNKMVRGFTLATRTSAYIHGAIWLFSITKYGFYFEYFYVSIGQYILRKMLKKKMKKYGFFLKLYSHIFCL